MGKRMDLRASRLRPQQFSLLQPPPSATAGGGTGRGAPYRVSENEVAQESLPWQSHPMEVRCSLNSTAIARRLRRDQTKEEKQLWRSLKAGRFAGFKFRRQHRVGGYFLDFYC